jgi:hypothetical protein
MVMSEFIEIGRSSLSACSARQNNQDNVTCLFAGQHKMLCAQPYLTDPFFGATERSRESALNFSRRDPL